MVRRKSSWLLISAVLLGVAALLVIVLAGILATHRTTTALERSAARNECARQISADLQEQFQHDVAALFNAAFTDNKANVKTVLARMSTTPNAADEINKRCPQPIAK